MDKLEEIIGRIKELEKELRAEFDKKEEEFLYTIKGKKVFFQEETKRLHKKVATRISTYLYHASFLNILTAPVIWFCIMPALFMNLVVSIYQFICFRVYRIPRVKRSDYFIMDRQSLSYLNPIEKLNCVYCGYFNGLVAYVQEIAGRTEQYWCPIKHARKLSTFHKHYYKFLDYGDHRDYQARLEALRKHFRDLSS
jgi:hypothetical protein